ncbi:MAG: hypothetical protein ACT4N9_01575 [Paracoccaceae bacterium]
MADANLKDFYDRVRRFERMKRKGLGFEAPGAIGRSHYRRPRSQGPGWLWRLVTVAGFVLVLKALLFLSVGAVVYGQRVARLRAGEGLEPLGGWIMQADPLTRWLADQIGTVLALVL